MHQRLVRLDAANRFARCNHLMSNQALLNDATPNLLAYCDGMEGIHPIYHLGVNGVHDQCRKSVSVRRGQQVAYFRAPGTRDPLQLQLRKPQTNQKSTMARSRATGRAKKQQPNKKNAKKAIVCSVCGKGDGK